MEGADAVSRNDWLKHYGRKCSGGPKLYNLVVLQLQIKWGLVLKSYEGLIHSISPRRKGVYKVG